jgi:hypothetical protein
LSRASFVSNVKDVPSLLASTLSIGTILSGANKLLVTTDRGVC